MARRRDCTETFRRRILGHLVILAAVLATAAQLSRLSFVGGARGQSFAGLAQRRHPTQDHARLASEQQLAVDEELYSQVSGYLDRVGGSCGLVSLGRIFRGADKEFLSRHFDVSDAVRAEDRLVSLPISAEEAKHNVEQKVQQVVRHLVRSGGSARIHETTRRFALSSRTLLEFDGGKLFKAENGNLQLQGGAGRVAAAGCKINKYAPRAGRTIGNSLLTSMGVPTDPDAAKQLQVRIEAFIMSRGDGLLAAEDVYKELRLKASPSLRRWFRRIKLKISAAGELYLSEHRLNYFRMRRAMSVAALLAANGGEASLDLVIDHIHRPPEFQGGNATEELEWMNRRASVELAQAPQAQTKDSSLALATMSSMSRVPRWIEGWVRDYFDVDGAIVRFPPDPVRSKGPGLADPYALAPEPTPEEEGTLMNVQEEMRLRYNRVHQTVLAGNFGVSSKWLLRFYDITPYGDVLPKSTVRQTQEAVAIARRLSDGPEYSLVQAFREFGAPKWWLQHYFWISDTDVLGFDDSLMRKWNPPSEERFENPRRYYKLDAPREYVRKGRKYLPRKYGHSAGGVLY